MQNHPNKKIFTIIVNAGGAYDLNYCLGKIFSSAQRDMQIVIVDTESKDGSIELAKRNYKNCHYLITPNKNYVSALNLALRFCLEKMADHIFITDKNTILKPSTINLLSQNLYSNCKTLIPSIQNEITKKRINYPLKIDWKNKELIEIESLPRNKNLISIEAIYPLPIMIHKDVFKEVGIFDEKLEKSWGFLDFFYKLRKHNYSIFLAPEIKVFSTKRILNISKNKFSRAIFFEKHSKKSQKLVQKINHLRKAAKK